MAEAKDKKEEVVDTIWSRRDFFSLAGWGSFMAALGLSSLYFARLLFPRVLFEPSPIFKAGYPSDYTVGAVSTCLLYTSPSPRDGLLSRMPSSA